MACIAVTIPRTTLVPQQCPDRPEPKVHGTKFPSDTATDAVLKPRNEYMTRQPQRAVAVVKRTGESMNISNAVLIFPITSEGATP